MFDYRHLLKMSYDRGMLQFSQLQRPDPRSGYTLDDNARALMIALHMEDGYEWASSYARFLWRAQRKDGSWCNLFCKGRYSACCNSEDSIGRALLACSMGASSPSDDISRLCRKMFEKNLPRVLAFRSPRAIAYSLLSICKYIQPSTAQYTMMARLSGQLISLYQKHKRRGWLWFEDYLTYCNGVLPQAMFAVYAAAGDKKALKTGHDSLDFLNEILFQEGYLNIVGNNGWYHKGKQMPRFDQQPVDAASTVFACYEAYHAIGRKEYFDLASLAHAWYRGKNIHGLSLYAEENGGCYDALTATGVNGNQGAEAVLSLLLSDLAMAGRLEQKRPLIQSS